jgi:heme-degrading monooxygenase HmoA
MTGRKEAPGYFAVIATTTLQPITPDLQRRYAALSERMLQLARQQDGFLGRESARDGGLGISVSYWRSEAAIKAWRNDVRHMATKDIGRREIYRTCRIRICRVEHEYEMGEPVSGFD